MVKITGSAIEFSATNQQTLVYPAVGTILLWGGDDINKLSTDYLLCDGNELLKLGQYGTLYGVVGDKYGAAPSGINYFKLPDLRERIPIGADNTTNVTYNSIYTGGVNKLVDAHYPHNHTFNVAWYYSSTRNGAEGDGDRQTCDSVNYTNTTNSPQFLSPNESTASQNYYPPYTLINYIIKAKTTLYTS